MSNYVPIAAALERLSCPSCGAGPGERCVTRTGHPARYLHGDRTYPLTEAFGEGYGEGFEDGQRFAARHAARVAGETR